MNEELFWSLIERARRPDELHAELATLPDDQLLGFERLHAVYMHRAYTWSLWGAAYVINGGCSDDTFEYFRSALISRGRDVYDRALTDPDSLAEVDLQDEEEWEDWMSPTMHVVHARSGNYGFVGPPEQAAPAQPTGEEWTDDELPSRFPRLTAKYGP
jgi:Protein of unknown function (DUF4240)